MQLRDLLDDMEENVNNRWQPSSDGLMLKEPLKHPCSRSLSKEQSKDKDKSKSNHKLSKSMDKSIDLQRDPSKKKRCNKCPQTKEGDVSVAVEDTELADTDIQETTAEMAAEAEQNQGVGQSQEDIHILDHDNEPPPVALPFVPIPWVEADYNCIKTNDMGTWEPHIVKALMDSIVLPDDLAGYVSVLQHTLINCHAELQYEVNHVFFSLMT